MKKMTRWVIAATAATLVLGACGGSGDDAGKASTGTIKIGVALPFTGGQAELADAEYLGAQTAAKIINEAGGVGGKQKIELIKSDDQAATARIAQNIRTLNDQGVAHVIGGQTTVQCNAYGESTNRYDMLFIGSHCVSPESVDPPVTPNFFMIGQQIGDLATGIGKRVAESNPDVETIDMLAYDYDSFHMGLEAFMTRVKADVGRDVKLDKKLFVPMAMTNFKNQLSDLQASQGKDKKTLFLELFGAGNTTFVKQADSLGLMKEYEQVAQVGAYWPSAVSLNGTAPRLLNVHDYFWDCQKNELNDKFVSNYKAVSGGHLPDTGAYQAFVSVYLIAAAIEKAGSADGPSSVKAMKGISVDTPSGVKMEVDAKTHAGLGSVTTAVLEGDKSVDDGVRISDCQIYSTSKDLR